MILTDCCTINDRYTVDLSVDDEEATPTHLVLTGGSLSDGEMESLTLTFLKLITGLFSLGEEDSMDLSEQTTPTPMKPMRAMDQDRVQVCYTHCYIIGEQQGGGSFVYRVVSVGKGSLQTLVPDYFPDPLSGHYCAYSEGTYHSYSVPVHHSIIAVDPVRCCILRNTGRPGYEVIRHCSTYLP